nr:MAG TPA: hypothetical protein [Caudoviricetes sp.]
MQTIIYIYITSDLHFLGHLQNADSKRLFGL